MSDDILSDIDALIAEDLERGERDEAHQLNPDPCPHCNEMWHGLPITRRMVEMRREYQEAQEEAYEVYREGGPGEVEYADFVVPEDYSYSDDDSHVFCPGSDVQGPQPPDRVWDCRHRLEYYGAQGKWRMNHFRTFRFKPSDWDPWEVVINTEAVFAISDPVYRRRVCVDQINQMVLTHKDPIPHSKVISQGIAGAMNCGHWEYKDEAIWFPPKAEFVFDELYIEKPDPDPKTHPDFFDVTTPQEVLGENFWLSPFLKRIPTSPTRYDASEYEKLWTRKGLAHADH